MYSFQPLNILLVYLFFFIFSRKRTLSRSWTTGRVSRWWCTRTRTCTCPPWSLAISSLRQTSTTRSKRYVNMTQNPDNASLNNNVVSNIHVINSVFYRIFRREVTFRHKAERWENFLYPSYFRPSSLRSKYLPSVEEGCFISLLRLDAG